NRIPFRLPRTLGSEPHGPGQASLRGNVPSAVPSLAHSSPAEKKTWPGTEDTPWTLPKPVAFPSPWLMSRTRVAVCAPAARGDRKTKAQRLKRRRRSLISESSRIGDTGETAFGVHVGAHRPGLGVGDGERVFDV